MVNHRLPPDCIHVGRPTFRLYPSEVSICRAPLGDQASRKLTRNVPRRTVPTDYVVE